MRIIQTIVFLLSLTPVPALAADLSIFELIRGNNIKEIKLLIKDTNALETVNDKGESPVFFASKLNKIDALLLLLGAGADANTMNYKGYSALTQAVSSKHEIIVRELIRAGADIYAIDSFSISPIQRMTDPTCHGTFVHWGKETEQLLIDTTNNTLDEFTWPDTIKYSCPMIRMNQKDTSKGEWLGWRKGYQSMPGKSFMQGEKLVLECEVDIRNKSAGLRIKNHYIDTCEYTVSAWSCSNKLGNTSVFPAPIMFAEVVGESDFKVNREKSYTYRPHNRLNQQPNGDIILPTRRTDLPLQIARLKLESGFNVDSCKIFRGTWHCKKEF